VRHQARPWRGSVAIGRRTPNAPGLRPSQTKHQPPED